MPRAISFQLDNEENFTIVEDLPEPVDNPPENIGHKLKVICHPLRNATQFVMQCFVIVHNLYYSYGRALRVIHGTVFIIM